MSKDKNLVKAGIISAAVHGFVIASGFLNIFKPQINSDMFLNIELAGAAEMREVLEDYESQSEDLQSKAEEVQQKEPEPKFEEVLEDQLVKGPSIIESQPELEPEPESEPKIEESTESGEALPPELKNEEVLRLEKERLDKEKAKKEKQEKLRKEEEKKRLEEKQKKEKRREEAERRRKKRLEAIKKIEKKNKARKKRLAKIAKAIKKKNNAAKKKKDDSFSKMMKNEKKNWSRLSRDRMGFGDGNGLGSYGDGMGFVNSDAAIVSSQIIPHWVVAGGVKNAETLIIRVRIKMKDNGEIPASSIEILDKDRYNSDSVFRSAADSAKRAILKASPLKIPAEKKHLFKDFEINFNTDKALGVRR